MLYFAGSFVPKATMLAVLPIRASPCPLPRFPYYQRRVPAVYSYMKHTNVASYTVAIKNGMHFVEEYADPVNTRTRVYAIGRDAWAQAQS